MQFPYCARCLGHFPGQYVIGHRRASSGLHAFMYSSDIEDIGPGPGGPAWEGRYTNCFQIGHNAFEFWLAFGQSYANTDADVLHTRLVTNPVVAVRLVKLLQESIDQYESRFGSIPVDEMR